MSLTKDRLIFDPADLTESDNIGSYTRAGSDGDLISSTNVGGKEGLDINLINTSIVVTATDLDIRDLAFATDSVTAYQGTSPWVVGDGGSSLTVDAIDLDIRDLTHVSDSVKIGDGTDFLAINADGSLNVNLTDDGVADDAVDSGNPFKIGSRSTNAALSALSAANDRADVISDLYRRVLVSDTPSISVSTGTFSVGVTEVAITALAGRTSMIIQNTSSNDVYVGATGLTTSDGIRIAKGSTMDIKVGQFVNMFLIAGSAANTVRVMQLA